MGIKERKEREKERRRQQILVAAKRVFVNKGFGKATMEDIANEAELSPGTLYLYFKSKDELCASLSVRILEYLIIRMEHLNGEKMLDTKQKIFQLKRALLDVYEFDPLIFRNLFYLKSSEAVQQLSPELMDEINALACTAMDKMTSFFEAGTRKESGVCRHPREITEILWAMFYGIILWGKDTNALDQKDENAHLEKLVSRAFEIFERGVYV
jgi:AcrR family transcriptional regulator